MSNQRLLAIGFIIIGGSVSLVLERIVDAVLRSLELANSELFGGLALSWVVAIALGLAGSLAAWFNPGIQTAGQEVAAELRRVTWPTGPEIRAATGAVVIVTLISAALLGLMDFVSAKVMTDWLPAGIQWAQGLFA
ncbi:MAG TPA: preprotein translocase subunit SecE [Vulgatibacter sp.]|nr:preprotein translocase subunit SecE [Vulgatibacter sp.]